MPDKPKLTVQTALKEFPDECLAIIPPQAGKLKVTNDPGAVQLMGDESDGHWHVEDECGEWVDFTWAELVGAAARWLEGKNVNDKAFAAMVAGKRMTHWYRWPDDMLRFFLEAVKEQLERENTKHKMPRDSGKTGEALGYA